MTATATTIGELFRSLGLTLTVRSVEDEDEAWACTLTRPDGKSYEIDSVSFFDVDPETGDEWIVEPSPSRVLSVLAGGDIEDEGGSGQEEGGESAQAEGTEARDDAQAGEDAEAAAREFLGDEAYELLNELDAAGLE